ncbi:MAG: hypothetical protein IJ593_11555 [Lachnospiraceae bacterium]|nr:hypothetical protein [Lachnospiraceae bacterium]
MKKVIKSLIFIILALTLFGCSETKIEDTSSETELKHFENTTETEDKPEIKYLGMNGIYNDILETGLTNITNNFIKTLVNNTGELSDFKLKQYINNKIYGNESTSGDYLYNSYYDFVTEITNQENSLNVNIKMRYSNACNVPEKLTIEYNYSTDTEKEIADRLVSRLINSVFGTGKFEEIMNSDDGTSIELFSNDNVNINAKHNENNIEIDYKLKDKVGQTKNINLFNIDSWNDYGLNKMSFYYNQKPLSDRFNSISKDFSASGCKIDIQEISYKESSDNDIESTAKLKLTSNSDFVTFNVKTVQDTENNISVEITTETLFFNSKESAVDSANKILKHILGSEFISFEYDDADGIVSKSVEYLGEERTLEIKLADIGNTYKIYISIN